MPGLVAELLLLWVPESLDPSACPQTNDTLFDLVFERLGIHPKLDNECSPGPSEPVSEHSAMVGLRECSHEKMSALVKVGVLVDDINHLGMKHVIPGCKCRMA